LKVWLVIMFMDFAIEHVLKKSIDKLAKTKWNVEEWSLNLD